MRIALLALLCAALGAAAALGIGRSAGLVGGRTTETVVVRGPAAAAPAGTLAAVRTAALPLGGGSAFSPARIFAARSPGVVTVFAYAGSSGAQGSGFVVSRDGTILTNAHVITNAGEAGPGTKVRPASRLYVEFADHDRVAARIVGWDVFDDVGVIRVPPSAHRLVPLPLGRSAAVVVGEPVAVIGSPLGNQDSLAVGVVSAVGRSIAALTAVGFELVDAIQTDAPIAHGSSGGPLLDAAGRVIGITAQIRDDSGGPAGIGFAVPIDAARRSLRALVAGGTVAYAYAGLQAEDLTPALAGYLGLPVAHGALVDSVSSGSPAARAGLRGGSRSLEFEGQSVRLGGDIVLAIDGTPVRNADDLVRIVTNSLRPGQTAVFTVLRDGRKRSIPLRLSVRR
ncbi:MAG TPA: trypsin-like peptidase domain-containing protein [Gaiellaceae bacterium]|nr:trypsin-like peptidase domain-containing protein [Gaiellaceae bacterium]